MPCMLIKVTHLSLSRREFFSLFIFVVSILAYAGIAKAAHSSCNEELTEKAHVISGHLPQPIADSDLRAAFREETGVDDLNLNVKLGGKLLEFIRDANILLPHVLSTPEKRVLLVPESYNFQTAEPSRAWIRQWLIGQPLHPQMPLDGESRNTLGRSEIILRKVQKEGIRASIEALKSGVGHFLMVGPPAIGKTEVLKGFLKYRLENDRAGLHIVVADRIDLVDQLYGQITAIKTARAHQTFRWDGTHRRGGSLDELARASLTKPIVLVSTIQTLKSELQLVRQGDRFRQQFLTFAYDESHHLGAPEVRKLVAEFVNAKGSNTFLFGDTATPIHADISIQQMFPDHAFWAYIDHPGQEENPYSGSFERPLSLMIDQVAAGIAEGDFTPFMDAHFIVPSLASARRSGERPVFRRDGERYVIDPDYYAQLLDQLREPLLRRRRGLIVANNINEANRLAGALRAALPQRKFAALHSRLLGPTPEAVMVDFRSGHIDYLVVVDMVKEGADVPDLDLLLDLSRMIHPRDFLQRLGRLSRLFPGKESAEFWTLFDVEPDTIRDFVNVLDRAEKGAFRGGQFRVSSDDFKSNPLVRPAVTNGQALHELKIRAIRQWERWVPPSERIAAQVNDFVDSYGRLPDPFLPAERDLFEEMGNAIGTGNFYRAISINVRTLMGKDSMLIKRQAQSITQARRLQGFYDEYQELPKAHGTRPNEHALYETLSAAQQLGTHEKLSVVPYLASDLQQLLVQREEPRQRGVLTIPDAVTQKSNRAPTGDMKAALMLLTRFFLYNNRMPRPTPFDPREGKLADLLVRFRDAPGFVSSLPPAMARMIPRWQTLRFAANEDNVAFANSGQLLIRENFDYGNPEYTDHVTDAVAAHLIQKELVPWEHTLQQLAFAKTLNEFAAQSGRLPQRNAGDPYERKLFIQMIYYRVVSLKVKKIVSAHLKPEWVVEAYKQIPSGKVVEEMAILNALTLNLPKVTQVDQKIAQEVLTSAIVRINPARMTQLTWQKIAETALPEVYRAFRTAVMHPRAAHSSGSDRAARAVFDTDTARSFDQFLRDISVANVPAMPYTQVAPQPSAVPSQKAVEAASNLNRFFTLQGRLPLKSATEAEELRLLIILEKFRNHPEFIRWLFPTLQTMLNDQLWDRANADSEYFLTHGEFPQDISPTILNDWNYCSNLSEMAQQALMNSASISWYHPLKQISFSRRLNDFYAERGRLPQIPSPPEETLLYVEWKYYRAAPVNHMDRLTFINQTLETVVFKKFKSSQMSQAQQHFAALNELVLRAKGQLQWRNEGDDHSRARHAIRSVRDLLLQWPVNRRMAAIEVLKTMALDEASDWVLFGDENVPLAKANNPPPLSLNQAVATAEALAAFYKKNQRLPYLSSQPRERSLRDALILGKNTFYLHLILPTNLRRLYQEWLGEGRAW